MSEEVRPRTRNKKKRPSFSSEPILISKEFQTQDPPPAPEVHRRNRKKKEEELSPIPESSKEYKDKEKDKDRDKDKEKKHKKKRNESTEANARDDRATRKLSLSDEPIGLKVDSPPSRSDSSFSGSGSTNRQLNFQILTRPLRAFSSESVQPPSGLSASVALPPTQPEPKLPRKNRHSEKGRMSSKRPEQTSPIKPPSRHYSAEPLTLPPTQLRSMSAEPINLTRQQRSASSAHSSFSDEVVFDTDRPLSRENSSGSGSSRSLGSSSGAGTPPPAVMSRSLSSSLTSVPTSPPTKEPRARYLPPWKRTRRTTSLPVESLITASSPEQLRERWHRPSVAEAELSTRSGKGRTLLMAAVESQLPEHVKLMLSFYTLLAPKLDVNLGDTESGYAALHFAASSAETNPCLLLLLSHPGLNVNQPATRGKTALSMFVRLNRDPDSVPDVLQHFQLAGAKFLEVDPQNGETLLHKALLNASIRLILFPELVNRGVDINQANDSGSTVLHFAVQMSSYPSVEFLVLNGASVSAPDKGGVTPVGLAVKLAALGDSSEIKKIESLLKNVQELTDFLGTDATPAVRGVLIKERLFLDVLNPEAVGKLRIPLGDKIRLEQKVREREIVVTELPKVEWERQLRAEIPELDEIKVDTDNVEFQQMIGRGSSSTVWQARLSLPGPPKKTIPVAVKKMTDLSEQEVRCLTEELKVLARITSPFLVSFYGVSVQNTSISVYLEYCSSGDLTHVLRDSPEDLSQPLALKWLLEMTAALAHLHEHGIVHRDLKSDNCLVTGSYDLKVTDFGLSRQLAGDGETLKEARGTPGYWPPELFGGSGEGYTMPSDIFSLGILFWEVWQTLSAPWARPFSDLDCYSAGNPFSCIGPLLLGVRPKMPASTPPPLVNLYNEMVAQEVEQRPSAREVFQRTQRLATSITGLK